MPKKNNKNIGKPEKKMVKTPPNEPATDAQPVPEIKTEINEDKKNKRLKKK